jgi:hypothetical protein
MSGSVSAADTCPTPDDPVNCNLWEILEILKKLSSAQPQDFNAFLFLKVRAGARAAWANVVREIGAAADADSAFVAAGHLQGCGPYNAVVEILADDHDQLLDLQLRITDVEGVEEYALGRVSAEDTRGWGDDSAPAE